MKSVAEIARMAVPKLERESHKRGYLARELVQCTLPHSKPLEPIDPNNPGKPRKELTEYERKDGNLTVTITANSKIGLPYGTIPRLLMLWVTSEAMRTQSRKLRLGSKDNDTLNNFLREVGLNPRTGNGKRGDAKRLREQMVRLFRARISFDYDQQAKPKNADAWLDMGIAPKGFLWWDFQQPDQPLLDGFESWIELDENFYQAITANAVPVNLTMAGNLKRSPLALDLFVWATYRLYRMRDGEQITVSILDLHRQFGSEYTRQRDFRAKLTHALESLSTVWSEELGRDAPISITKRGLRLTGIPHRELPVQPERNSGLLSRRDPTDPFSISSSELMRIADYAQGWDVRALRREWQAWCKANGTTPDNPVAHFTAFVKTHKNKNG